MSGRASRSGDGRTRSHSPPAMEGGEARLEAETGGNTALAWAICVWLPFAAAWGLHSRPWTTLVGPALADMQRRASTFRADHPLQLAGTLQAFKQSQTAWHTAILRLQEAFRKEYRDLLGLGELGSETTLLLLVTAVFTLCYATLFLPDAAILLPRRLRLNLSCVKYLRPLAFLLAAHQLYVVGSLLAAASKLSDTMQGHIKSLKREQKMLALEGRDVGQYNLLAEKFDGQRWGVKLLNYTIDDKFWTAFQMNLMGGLLVGGSLGWYLWGLIQDARHTQGRHRRRFLEKLGGRSVARHLVHTEEAESVVSQPASEGVQLRRNISRRHPDLEGLDAIPFDQLKFVEEIGHGAHGVVFRGKYSGADVAIKQIPISPDGSNRRKIQVEVGIFLGCRHPHLVQCLGVSDRPSSPPKICIVTEYCRYGSLDDLLHRKQQRVTDKRMMQWMKEIYLHEKGIIHRDLKPANVLMANSKSAKITDYGVSWIQSLGRSSVPRSEVGTPDYLAPEVMQEAPHDFHCDVYSYGVLINECASRDTFAPKGSPQALTSCRPWQHLAHAGEAARMLVIMNKVGNQQQRPPLSPNTTAEFRQLVVNCWDQDPERRPTFAEVHERLEAMGTGGGSYAVRAAPAD